MYKKKGGSRILSLMVAIAMVITMLPGSAFAASEKYAFGPDGTEFAPGVYTVSAKLMNASNTSKPSMAAGCIQGASLEVKENGDGYITLKLGPVSVMGLKGWSGNWKIFNEYNMTSDTTDAEVLEKDKNGNEKAVRFKLLNKDADGVYARMSVKAMSMNPEAFIKINYSEGNKEEKPEVSVLKGKSDVSFDGVKAYDVSAEVKVTDGVIDNVTFDHNAEASGHKNSVAYAEKAKAMAENFKGRSKTDREAVEGIDGVTGATLTSDAYRNAVLDALGYKPAVKDFTFGKTNVKLEPGTYEVPLSLRHAVKHDSLSAAAGAFPATGKLTVSADGTATLTTDVKVVAIATVKDMAHSIKYYTEDGCSGTAKDVTVLKTVRKPEGMINEGKEVPAEISFKIPDNHFDGVYMNFTVDAMGGANPDGWLFIDYAEAKTPGGVTHFKGSAKVNQFGKYTIYTDVSVKDGVITDVDVRADDFISETHRAVNEMKTAQVKEALKSAWNGIAPTQENAEKIFKKIMKESDPDQVIDGVSGATYSAKATRDAVMNAFDLEYRDEIINVPDKVEPGVYEVEVGYYSDVVLHSLVENTKTKAVLTAGRDGSMKLDLDLKSGTDKEPLYILGFNGVYPDNDKDRKLTMEGCSYKMGLSSDDYEDENFAKGTKVVNHVTFPLLGGMNRIYNTNARIYVPAMKGLTGNLSGVEFENGKFNVDVYAKIYWDGMKKIDNVPVTADKSALSAKLEKAKGETGKTVYTESSLKALKNAVKNAEKVMNSGKADQTAVDNAVKSLDKAIRGLKLKSAVKPEKPLDYENLEDGIYLVKGKLVKATDKSKESMADNAINHNIRLTVKDGKYFVTIDFRGMKIGDRTGYLGDLKYFKSGYRVNKYGEPEGALGNTEKKGVQTDKNGKKVRDEFGTDYPDMVTFRLIPEALKDGYAPVQVSVPLMESIAPGLGKQPAYLALDWKSLEKVKADDDRFENDNTIAEGGVNGGSGINGDGNGKETSGINPAVKGTPQTGDRNDSGMLMLIMFAAGTAVLALRRKNENVK